MSSPPPTSAPSSPPRVIGPWTGLAVVAGSMLGVGVFLAPPVMAAATPGWAFWAIWIGAGLAALSGAVAYAELGSMMPEAGGDYRFIHEAFGPHWAFAAGHLMFAGAFAGSIAAMAVALCQYQLAGLLHAAGLAFDPTGPLLGVAAFTPARLGAVALILGFTGLNVAGARASARAQAAMTLVPVALMAGIAVMAVIAGSSAPAGSSVVSPPVKALTGGGLSQAWLAAYFAYAGWPALVYVAGEVREPSRTLPIALVGGAGLTMALYLLLNAAMLGTLGWEGLSGAGEAGTATARALGGAPLELVMTGLIASALAASINGTVLGGGRVALKMAERGAFPVAFSGLSLTGTPSWGLWLQAGLASALALSGSFTQVLSLTSVAMMAVGSMSVAALFVLRRRWTGPRPYRATGYPLTPLFYLLSSVVALGLTAEAAWSAGTLEAAYPLMGLGVLGVAWLGHRVARA